MVGLSSCFGAELLSLVVETVAHAVKHRKGLFGNIFCCFGTHSRQLDKKNTASRESVKVSDDVSIGVTPLCLIINPNILLLLLPFLASVSG